MLFFNIHFFGFWPRFWRLLGLQLGAKSGTLLAAPAVLKPIGILLALTYCFACFRGGGAMNPIRSPNWPCWDHVGTMLAHFSLLARSVQNQGGPRSCRRHLGPMLAHFSSKSRLVGTTLAHFWILNTLWHLLGLFVSPLQRAGTCEAHGINRPQTNGPQPNQ